MYLLLVNSKMPKTSTAFPLLTKFYGSVIIILVLAMCCTCLVYALYFMNSSGLELHHASFFLHLKVRATRKRPFRSPESQHGNSHMKRLPRNSQGCSDNSPMPFIFLAGEELTVKTRRQHKDSDWLKISAYQPYYFL